MLDNNCYAKVIGGLGNQLFIIAAAYAYSKKYNKELCIDTSGWTASQGKSPQNYVDLLSNFNWDCEALHFVTPINEKRFNYDELPYYDGPVSINGYFQSLKYFEECAEEFKSLLVLPKVNSSFIREKNVAFHIRRGDYLRFPDFHYVCKTEYFRKQFREFDGYQVNIFTDSPDYVLKEFDEYTFNLIETSSELNDLTLMSKHANIVGSNSSFSWWASFLGNCNKCIFPDKWFANGMDSEDIYRPDMIRVKV